MDFGTRRTGLAVTDPMQIIATALETVETKVLLEYLKKYCEKEPVERIVIGYAPHADGTDTYVEAAIQELIGKLRVELPDLLIVRQNERGTSKQAKAVIAQSGYKKSKRHEKGLVDKVSAVIILQEHLGF